MHVIKVKNYKSEDPTIGKTRRGRVSLSPVGKKNKRVNMLRNFAREMCKTFIFHAAASHFVNGLFPVAVLFMLLALVTADTYFEHTVIHLIGIASLTVPISFISGIRDWRVKFQSGRAPIFYRKIKLSIVLAILCATIISIRFQWPNPLAAGGKIALLYGGCIIMTLPIVILLGHFGGKLAYAARLGSAKSDQR